MMKKLITIAFVLLSGICYGQEDIKIIPVDRFQSIEWVVPELRLDSDVYRLDSVKIVFDKDGNMIRKEFYSLKSTYLLRVKNNDEKSPINKN